MSHWTAREIFSFTGPLAGGRDATHDVHVAGDGPPILILQELPGIGPETLALAQKLNNNGFTVYLPHLFGTFGKITMKRNLLRMLCIRREFNIFLKGKQSPVAAWMGALASHIREREGSEGVGVIGMCLTGSFALSLMAEDAVVGGVASQPALPVRGHEHLHMSEADVANARAGMEAKGTGLAMRYSCDKLSTRTHLRALEQAFGELLETETYAGDGHSLLTLDFHDPAYDRMHDYFRARFGMSPAS